MLMQMMSDKYETRRYPYRSIFNQGTVHPQQKQLLFKGREAMGRTVQRGRGERRGQTTQRRHEISCALKAEAAGS